MCENKSPEEDNISSNPIEHMAMKRSYGRKMINTLLDAISNENIILCPLYKKVDLFLCGNTENFT